ncbi:MAG: PAS domain S-box protein [Syntrophaceae bacterium]|nr:PAS domain S-box protein [Syntrophaceae bacterium]
MSEKQHRKAKNYTNQHTSLGYRDLVWNAPIGIYTATPEGRFIDVNPAMAHMFGYTSPQEMMETITDIATQLYVDPEERESVMRLLEEKGELVDHERRHINKDGSVVWISANVRAIRDEKDKTTLYQGFFTDISKRKRAEEILRESEERYRSIVRVSKTGVWQYQFDTGNLWCNPEYFELLGYDPETFNAPNGRSLITDAWIGLIHPDDQENATRLFMQYLFYGSPDMYESIFRMRHKDGHWVWIWSRGQTLRNPDGTLSNLTVGTHIDITDRIFAEDALRKSEAKYRSLTERMSDILWTCDLEMHTTYVSHSVERVLGFTTDEWMNLPIEKQVAPETLRLALEVLADNLRHDAQRNPNRQILLNMEYFHRNGTIRCLESVMFFIRDESGKPVGIQGLSRDITERKRTQEALLKSEDELRKQQAYMKLIFDTSAALIVAIGVDGKTKMMNQAMLNLLEYTQEEVRGVDYLATFVPVEDHETVEAIFQQIIREGKMTTVNENQIRSKSGRIYDTEWHGGSGGGEGGAVDFFVGVGIDITVRKQAEKKLKETLDHLRKAIDTTIQVMVSATEVRDPYTAGHQIRVACLAKAIATEMGLPQDKIEGIRLAGTIHDIGKLSIPAEILSKPGKLSSLEFALVKEHPKEGYKILKDVESPWPLAEIVYQHHERLDGSGYPRNLKGDEILLEARILSVADEVEAMATHRPYRPSLGIDAALEDIEKNKGILYDADVVDACLKLFREKGFELDNT